MANIRDIGLTGGIASGKGEIEKKFKKSGFLVFNTDEVEKALRTGNIRLKYNHPVLRYPEVIRLMKRLSQKVKKELKKQLPREYNQNKFDREKHLNYINDKIHGEEYENKYSGIMNKYCIIVYLFWRKMIKKQAILSSGTLIERKNLRWINKLIIIKISNKQQLKNLIKRERKNRRKITAEEALKAIKRHYSFEKKLRIAEQKLGRENVFIIGKTPNDLSDIQNKLNV